MRCAAAALLGAAGCEERIPTVFDAPVPPRMLAVATYDGSGQVVHPDVIRVGSDADFPYWMAITPYPFSDEKMENPSIYRSRDGLRWEEPRPRLNPIVPRPPFDHNSDPDLTHRGGMFLLYWLETQRREYRPDSLHFQRLRVAASEDGATWKGTSPAIEWNLDREPLYVSPALVAGPHGDRLYLVDSATREIVWLPVSGLKTFGAPAGRLDPGLPDLAPWHVDVFPAGEGFVALVCASSPEVRGEFALWIGASPDLDAWAFRPEPLLAPGSELLDTDLVYRATGLVERGRLAVWFSARTAAGRWFLGVASWDEEVILSLFRAAAPHP
jgi:hypothetical protein